MNQYLLNPVLVRGGQGPLAEQVLRIALFSHIPLPGHGKTLGEVRAKLAAGTRIKRCRSIVPILIGLLWFLFILALSVASSE
jgi:hypothetical protein